MIHHRHFKVIIKVKINLAEHPEKVSSSKQSQGMIVPILAKVDQGFKQLQFDDNRQNNIDDNENREKRNSDIGEHPESGWLSCK